MPSAFDVYLWVMAINILRRSKSLFVVLAGLRQTVYQLSAQPLPAQQSFYSSQRFSSAFSSRKVTALSFAELVCLLGSVFDEPAFQSRVFVRFFSLPHSCLDAIISTRDGRFVGCRNAAQMLIVMCTCYPFAVWICFATFDLYALDIR